MANPILTEADLTEITRQLGQLKEGVLGDTVSSLTVRLGNGTSGTFTRNIDKEWQITLSGKVEDGYHR